MHLTSDLLTPISGTLTLEQIRWADSPATAVHSTNVHVVVGPATSAVVWQGNADVALGGLAAARTQSFVRLTFEPDSDQASSPTKLEPVHTELWLSIFREAELPVAAPRVVRISQLSPTRASVHVATNSTAARVTVECSTVVGAFSDGALTLLAGAAPSLLLFEGRRAFTLEEFTSGLRVRSLRDTYD